MNVPRLFVAGKYRAASEIVPLLEAATGEPLGDAPSATEADIDAAVVAAHSTQAQEWRAARPDERAEVMIRFASALRERAEDTARLVSRDTAWRPAHWDCRNRHLTRIENLQGIRHSDMGRSGRSLQDDIARAARAMAAAGVRRGNRIALLLHNDIALVQASLGRRGWVWSNSLSPAHRGEMARWLSTCPADSSPRASHRRAGIANVFEIATHLLGEGGDRQIEGASVGLAPVIDLGSACGVHILER